MAVSPTEKRAQTRAARDTPRIFLSRRRKSNKPITLRATAGVVLLHFPWRAPRPFWSILRYTTSVYWD